jgi:hypothetical protein
VSVKASARTRGNVGTGVRDPLLKELGIEQWLG